MDEDFCGFWSISECAGAGVFDADFSEEQRRQLSFAGMVSTLRFKNRKSPAKPHKYRVSGVFTDLFTADFARKFQQLREKKFCCEELGATL